MGDLRACSNEDGRPGPDSASDHAGGRADARPTLVLVPDEPRAADDEATVLLSEEDLLKLERRSDAAMVAASINIANTAEALADSAEAARRARIAADAREAEVIAACMAETAAAFKQESEATTLRARWMAAREAKAAAGRVQPGREGRASDVAARTAGEAKQLEAEREAFDRRAAGRACEAAKVDIGRVEDAVDKTAVAAKVTSSAQRSALGRIASDTSLQVAINQG